MVWGAPDSGTLPPAIGPDQDGAYRVFTLSPFHKAFFPRMRKKLIFNTLCVPKILLTQNPERSLYLARAKPLGKDRPEPIRQSH